MNYTKQKESIYKENEIHNMKQNECIIQTKECLIQYNTKKEMDNTKQMSN